MSTTRSRTDTTVLAPIDIADQPETAFLFLIEGPSGTQAFAVDTYYPGEIATVGRRGGRDIVAVPSRSPWTVIARSAVVFRTLEESIRKQKTDQEQGGALVTAIFGAAAQGVPVDPSPLPATPLLLPPVGHYI